MGGWFEGWDQVDVPWSRWTWRATVAAGFRKFSLFGPVALWPIPFLSSLSTTFVHVSICDHLRFALWFKSLNSGCVCTGTKRSWKIESNYCMFCANICSQRQFQHQNYPFTVEVWYKSCVS